MCAKSPTNVTPENFLDAPTRRMLAMLYARDFLSEFLCEDLIRQLIVSSDVKDGKVTLQLDFNLLTDDDFRIRLKELL